MTVNYMSVMFTSGVSTSMNMELRLYSQSVEQMPGNLLFAALTVSLMTLCIISLTGISPSPYCSSCSLKFFSKRCAYKRTERSIKNFSTCFSRVWCCVLTLGHGESSLAFERTWIPGETSWMTMASPLGLLDRYTMLLDAISATIRLNPLYRWTSFTSDSANSFGLFVLYNGAKNKISH